MPDQGLPAKACGSIGRLPWRVLAVAASTWLAACTTGFNTNDVLNGSSPPPASTSAIAPPAPAVVAGAVKVGLILPLSAGGNAGNTGQAMRNAAELAVSEYNLPVQLLIKDDSGTTQGAQQAARQAVDEGAEIVLGPLFAHSVNSAKAVARSRGIPIIAFSTDSNVAAPGAYLLSFLPESDVDRVVAYAVSQGKHAFAAMIPSNAYGTVVEGAFKQAVARLGARVVAIEHYTDRASIGAAARVIAQSASRADALFIPDQGDAANDITQALLSNSVNIQQFAILGTQLWDDPHIFSNPALEGGWYPAPDPAALRDFGERYRTRYHQEPPAPAALAYDAVTLVAALAKTKGPQRFSAEALTDPLGFAGIAGVFRFRTDGTNQRGLAIMRVTPSGGQIIAPAPRTFSASAT